MSLRMRWGMIGVLLILAFGAWPGTLHTASVIQPGETLHYDIKKFGIKVGAATLTFKGPVSLEGQPALLIVFDVRSLKFFDREEIYLDPQTWYPRLVRRDLNLWGKREKILEQYDAPRGQVVITKKIKGQSTHQVIQKGAWLDNIYAFIYRYRRDGAFQRGDALRLNLPTKDVEVQFLQQKQVKIDGQPLEAYVMQSHPKQYTLWFGTHPAHLPLKIDGAVAGGKATLVFTHREP